MGAKSHEAAEQLKNKLVVELWQNVERLLRQELALASAELDVKAGRLKRELTGAAIGGGFALAGALALVAAVILLLDLVMAAWLAALVSSASTTSPRAPARCDGFRLPPAQLWRQRKGSAPG
jgi:hypothetical protein